MKDLKGKKMTPKEVQEMLSGWAENKDELSEAELKNLDILSRMFGGKDGDNSNLVISREDKVLNYEDRLGILEKVKKILLSDEKDNIGYVVLCYQNNEEGGVTVMPVDSPNLNRRIYFKQIKDRIDQSLDTLEREYKEKGII